MRSHLCDADLLEIAESGADHPHLLTCTTCRRHVDGLREALAAAQAVTVPEPSPLFWPHFTARVGRAVDADRALRPGVWLRSWRVAPVRWLRVAALASVLVLAGLTAWRLGLPTGTGERMPASGANGTPGLANATGGESEPRVDFDQESDAAWALVTDVGADIDLDEAASAGFDMQPGAAERAAAQLTTDEQQELLRLLHLAVEDEQP